MEHPNEQQQQQQQQEEAVSPFDQQLTRLRRAKHCDLFSFRETLAAPAATVAAAAAAATRWTMEQALAVSEALTASKGLVSLYMELEVCRPEAIGLFLKYIGASKSLKLFGIRYDCRFPNNISDSSELQQSYRSKIDDLFHAVLQNPSIEKLETSSLGANPTAIFELLANSRSLTSFKLSMTRQGEDPNYEMTFHTAAGFRQNSTLTKVELCVSNYSGNLGRLISGLDRHESLHELAVSYQRPDEYVYWALSNLIQFTTSLQKLEVVEEYTSIFFTCNATFDRVLLDLYRPNLCQPIGHGLKVLSLVKVRIGLGWKTIQDTSPSVMEIANDILEELILDRVTFVGLDAAVFFANLWGSTSSPFNMFDTKSL